MAKFNPNKKSEKPAKNTKTGGDSEFLNAMSGYKQAYDEAKTATADDFPDASKVAEALGIAAGEKVRVVARTKEVRLGVDGSKNPYVVFVFTVERGKGKGTSLDIFYSVKPKKDKTVADALSYICRAFQRLGYETEDTTMEDIVGMAKDATNSHSLVQLNVKYDGEYLNTFIVKSLDDEDEQQEEEGQEEEAEEEETEEEVEVEDDEDQDDPGDEEETEEEEQDEPQLSKGMTVLYQAKGARKPEACKVLTVSDDDVTLKRERDGKKFSGVPLSEVEIVDED